MLHAGLTKNTSPAVRSQVKKVAAGKAALKATTAPPT